MVLVLETENKKLQIMKHPLPRVAVDFAGFICFELLSDDGIGRRINRFVAGTVCGDKGKITIVL